MYKMGSKVPGHVSYPLRHGRAQMDSLDPAARQQMFPGKPDDHTTNSRAYPRG